ncbi:MAG TPA: hypothetical protein EYP63_02100, partial [Desulfotomaculum sp.]|nr:hypothetical protein [Desulfotomaculum sp.]
MEKRTRYPVLTALFTLILLITILPLPALAFEQPGGGVLEQHQSVPALAPRPDLAVWMIEFPQVTLDESSQREYRLDEEYARPERGQISAPFKVTQGESVEVTVTVQNRGDPNSLFAAAAPAGYLVELILSRDDKIPYHPDQWISPSSP